MPISRRMFRGVVPDEAVSISVSGQLPAGAHDLQLRRSRCNNFVCSVYNVPFTLDLEKLMHRKLPIVPTLAFALVSFTTIACSDSTPVSPTPSSQALALAADGSSLKVTAPTLLSPINGTVINGLRPTLEIAGSAGQYVNPQGGYQYTFEVQTASGALVRSETLSATSWAFPANLDNDTPFQWRARAVRNSAFGPWSAPQTFRTRSLPGCENGLLVDMRAYFFFVINRTEGQPARDWEEVMRASGIPAGPVAGQRFPPNAPHYGLSQQISSSGELRGRVFLPTNTPNPAGYFIQDVDFLSDPSGSRWAWHPHGSPAYAPRPCP
jgi:hypothetical protein